MIQGIPGRHTDGHCVSQVLYNEGCPNDVPRVPEEHHLAADVECGQGPRATELGPKLPAVTLECVITVIGAA